MSVDNQATSRSAERLQILSFVLDGDSFGTEISCIQEVLEYRKVTSVPRTPEYMLGVINLRGQVVPVVDLRQIFAMKVTEPTVDSCIIIVKIPIEGEETALGILADRVKEVVEFNFDELSAPPRIGNRVDSHFIAGMLQHDEEFLIMLNLTRVFSANQLHNMLGSTEPLLDDVVESDD